MSWDRHTDTLRNFAHGGQGRDELVSDRCGAVGREVTLEPPIIDRQSRFGHRRS